MKKEPTSYPWALLYNLESQLEQPAQQRKRRVGRPRNPIPRARTTLLMTAEEKRMLQQLTSRIQEMLFPAKVTRSQVVGLALRLVDLRLTGTEYSADIEDWSTLIAALQGGDQG